MEPMLAFWSRKPYSERGAWPVAEGFSYVSTSNDEGLECDGLAEYLRASGLV